MALHLDAAGKPCANEGLGVCQAWRKIGNVGLAQGDTKQALAAFQKARQALEASTKTTGDNAAVLSAHEELAGSFASVGEPEISRGLLDQGLALVSARDEESLVKLRQGMVDRHKQLAADRLKLKDADGARREFAAAIELEKRMVVEMPGRDESFRLANLHSDFAELLVKLNDSAAAAAQYEAEALLLEDILKQFPDSDSFSRLASALIRIRKTQNQQHEAQAAKATSDKLHGVLDRWIEQLTRDGNQDRLAGGYQAVAHFYILLGEPRTGLERLDSRLLVLEKIYEKSRDAAHRETLFDACLELSGYQQEIGDKTAAAATAKKLTDLLSAWLKETEAAGSRPALVAALQKAADYYEKLHDNKLAAEALVRSAQVEEEEARATHQPLRDAIFSYFNRALKCLALEQPALADTAMTKCRSLAVQEFTAPEDRLLLVRVYSLSVDVKLKLDDRAAAEKLCQEALAVPIDFNVPKFAKADEWYKQYQMIGSRLEDLQNYAQAAEAFRRCVRLAIKLDSGTVSVGASTGVLLTGAKRVIDAYWYLGDVEMEGKNLPAADEAYGQMLKRADETASKYPDPSTRMLLATAHEKVGELRVAEKEYPPALAEFKDNLAVRLELAGDPQDVSAQLNLSRAYRLLSSLAETTDDIAAARDWSQKRADALLLTESKTHSEKLHTALANACLLLAWYDVLTRRPLEGVEAGLTGMKFDPDSPYVAMNLAHAYLFSDQIDKAKALYLKFKAAKFGGPKTFAQVALEDFAVFRKQGLDNPHLAEIEALLK